jgi:hypothetical protein
MSVQKFTSNTVLLTKYCKLVETFHNVSECETAVYYSLGGQVIVTVNPLLSLYYLTDQELQLATETE